MKKDSLGCLNPIRKQDLETLMQVTSERIATNLKPVELERSFGPVDMWNRHKKQRTSLQMRRWLN
ncbi:MAG: hypothetical protein V4725_00300 [Bacteroidota bacterium]